MTNEGAVHQVGNVDCQLREGRRRLQTETQRSAGQHRPQVTSSIQISYISHRHRVSLCKTPISTQKKIKSI